MVRGATAISAFWTTKVFVTIVVNPEQRHVKQESNGEPGSDLICLFNTITLGQREITTEMHEMTF